MGNVLTSPLVASTLAAAIHIALEAALPVASGRNVASGSNVLTSSSVASLDAAFDRGTILRNVSRECEFLDFVEDRTIFRDVSRDFFCFMRDDAGGIMSHINTLMEQELGHLVHDWKHVNEDPHQTEQLIANVQRFRILCKDFLIHTSEYDCLTSNFLVQKPCGLRMNYHPFFMTARMMRKLRACRSNYSVIELRDKYELLENFLLRDGEHFEDTFKLGSTVVQVKSIENPSVLLGKTVNIKVDSKILRVVSCKSHEDLNLGSKVQVLEVPDFDPCIGNNDEIKFVGRVLSCLKHMSNYEGYEAQFGVIDKLGQVGCDNFIVAVSPTIHKIIQMQPPNDMELVDLSKVSDIPLIFGTKLPTN